MSTPSGTRETLFRLPEYVEQRNRRAVDAGLTMEKQQCRQRLLTTWYRGSEDQIAAAGFFPDSGPVPLPKAIGARKLFCLNTFSPAEPAATIRGSLVRIDEHNFRLVISGERVPESWRSLGKAIDVYKFSDLKSGLNQGPATVYIGAFAALRAAEIAPAEAESESHQQAGNSRLDLWQSEALNDGRHRFVVFHEAEEHAQQAEDERSRANFHTPEEYQDWLLEVVTASIGMIKRQLRVKTRGRQVYSVPRHAYREIENHLARLRRTLARCEIVVQQEDTRGLEARAQMRAAALNAMKDSDFQQFLGRVFNNPERDPGEESDL